MKLFRRIKEWRDRRFLKRLERVLNKNVIKSNMALSGGFAFEVPPETDLSNLFKETKLNENDLEMLRKAEHDYLEAIRD